MKQFHGPCVFGDLLLIIRFSFGQTLKPIIRLRRREDGQTKANNVISLTSWVCAGVVSLIYGGTFASSWEKFLLYFNGTKAGLTDPIFGKDIGFYMFSLPLLYQ